MKVDFELNVLFARDDFADGPFLFNCQFAIKLFRDSKLDVGGRNFFPEERYFRVDSDRHCVFALLILPRRVDEGIIHRALARFLFVPVARTCIVA